SSLPLGLLLRFFELECTPTQLTAIAAACHAYFSTPRGTSIPIYSGHSATFVGLLIKLELILTKARLAPIMRRASASGTLPNAMALAVTYRTDKCKGCSKQRLFR